MTKEIHLSAFDMCSLSPAFHGMWRHPRSERRKYAGLDFWLDRARLLERGGFDMLFLADVLGMYDVHGGSWATSVREGTQVPCHDPMMAVSAMAAVTEHLGFAMTFSTSYEPPFPFARRMSTLDHLTRGRVAWNVVTSFLPSAAKNFGLPAMMEHDRRYARAEEFLDVCYQLWEGSWEDDAVIAGEAYADPSKVHEINHAGEYFRVMGPHLAEPSPQRTPVLFQAGASPVGRSFAGRHAECVFLGTSASAPEALRREVDELRETISKAGRDPNQVKSFVGVSVVVAETAAEARLKVEQSKQWISSEGVLAQIAGATGYDLAGYSPDTLVRDMTAGHRGIFVRDTTPPDMAVGDLLNSIVEQITTDQLIVGTPQDVADQLEEMAESTGIDGVNIGESHPDTFADVVDLLVPELRKRGVLREANDRTTLRERLFDTSAHLPSSHPAARYRR